jgi:tetratricopeptide (TPR) repeat protein
MSGMNPLTAQVSYPTANPDSQSTLSNPTLLNPTTGGWLIFTLLAAITAYLWRNSSQRSPQSPAPTQLLRYIEAAKRYEYENNYKQAIATYEAGLEDYPNDYRLWHERGLAFAKLRQFKDAIASYDRAYALRPDLRDLAHERGDALLELDRYEDAIASLDIFLRYEPNSSHVWTDRGYALYRLGRYPEAVECLKRAQSIKFSGQPGESVRNRYYHIMALYYDGQIEAAKTAVTAARREHPDHPDFKELYAKLQRVN